MCSNWWLVPLRPGLATWKNNMRESWNDVSSVSLFGIIVSTYRGPEIRRTSIAERHYIIDLKESDRISSVAISTQLGISVSPKKDDCHRHQENGFVALFYSSIFSKIIPKVRPDSHLQGNTTNFRVSALTLAVASRTPRVYHSSQIHFDRDSDQTFKCTNTTTKLRNLFCNNAK